MTRGDRSPRPRHYGVGVLVLALGFACVSMARAAEPKTYFVSSTGSDAASGLAGTPWRTFAKAWQSVGAGDTIVVSDGVYPDASPPPGKSGSAPLPITVRAANAGGATLSPMSFKGTSHLALIGFRIEGQQYAVSITSNGPGRPSHHLVFQQIGFSCVANTLNDNGCFSLSDGSHHILLEDSWGWGGGRYTVLCYGGPGGQPANVTCDHNTFRRLVLRQGPTRSSPENPQASISLYYAANNLVENVIAIDGLASSDTSNAAFYVTAHTPPPTSSLNRFVGVIALNNLGAGLWLDCRGAICVDVEARDSVFWGSSGNGINIQGGTCTGVVIDRNTIGAASVGYNNHRCEGTTLTNNAFYGNSGLGARQSPTAGGSTPTAHHNGYFGNRGGARESLRAGAGDLSSNPGLLYLPRIESSSPYKNSGVSGDIGANVLTRLVNGNPTAAPLWPWPFEDRLRAEMCHAAAARGFCASGKTLTRYVWEYLGKPLPAGIYP